MNITVNVINIKTVLSILCNYYLYLYICVHHNSIRKPNCNSSNRHYKKETFTDTFNFHYDIVITAVPQIGNYIDLILFHYKL